MKKTTNKNNNNKFPPLKTKKIIGILRKESKFEKKTKSLNSVFSLGIDLIYELFRINKNLVPHNISRNIISFINKNKKIKDLSIKYANFGNL